MNRMTLANGIMPNSFTELHASRDETPGTLTYGKNDMKS